MDDDLVSLSIEKDFCDYNSTDKLTLHTPDTGPDNIVERRQGCGAVTPGEE